MKICEHRRGVKFNNSTMHLCATFFGVENAILIKYSYNLLRRKCIESMAIYERHNFNIPPGHFGLSHLLTKFGEERMWDA